MFLTSLVVFVLNFLYVCDNILGQFIMTDVNLCFEIGSMMAILCFIMNFIYSMKVFEDSKLTQNMKSVKIQKNYMIINTLMGLLFFAMISFNIFMLIFDVLEINEETYDTYYNKNHL